MIDANEFPARRGSRAPRAAAESPVVRHHAPAGFFWFRTPLLPFETLVSWQAAAASAESTGPEATRAGLREGLAALIDRPEVREAIFLASPTLEAELQLWRAQPDSERGQKVERALVRYLARMAGRATPFGLFAGAAVGALDERTDLALAGISAARRHVRPDMELISNLVDELCSRPAVRERLRFRPNTSLYEIAGQLRYMESREEEKRRSFDFVGIPDSPHFRVALERASHGATPRELVDALRAFDASYAPAELQSFVSQLIDNEVLVPDLAPRVTGPEALTPLIDQLAVTEASPETCAVLQRSADAFAALRAAPLGQPPSRYRDLAAPLLELSPRSELGRTFQVDLVKAAPDARLGHEVVESLREAAELLQRLGGSASEHPLDAWRVRFSERYEGREVPLVEVLDEDWGIASPRADPSPLLEGLPFPGRGGGGALLSPFHAMLLSRAQQTERAGEKALTLTPDELKPFFNPRPAPLPESFSVMASLAAKNAEDVAAGRFQVFVEGVLGPSAAGIMARFCHADPRLHAAVEKLLREEEQSEPEALFAEIVHLPEGRIGNIVARPVLREYEIVYLGASGAQPERQLPVTDLMLSVRDGRFVLRSQRLNREVIPRLTNAHNFVTGVPLYQFLAQFSPRAAGGWDWGALSQLPFLPRIVVGKAVLSLARWLLTQDEIATLQVAPDKRASALLKLRADRGLPRWVAVKDGDNELPVDLENALSVESFCQLIKKRPAVALVEVFPGPDELCAHGPDGRFVHELIVPFVQRSEARSDPKPTSQPEIARTRSALRPSGPRVFVPGSPWLYVKLYTAVSAADRILRDVVAPLVAQARTRGLTRRWFFIRYNDPDFHLRVRFEGEPEQLMGELLPIIHQQCAGAVAAGVIRRLALDTYQREVERYGGDLGIELAENVFCADSDAALAMIGTLDDSTEVALRWQLAFLGLHRLLGDLRLGPDETQRALGSLRDGLWQEHGVDGAFEQKLGERFRQQRRLLEELSGPTPQVEPQVLTALDRRTAVLEPIVRELMQAGQQGRLSESLGGFAQSQLHMHANRMLRSSARAQELVLYDWLLRIYESQRARARQKGAS